MATSGSPSPSSLTHRTNRQAYRTMHVPPKYQELMTFHKYYSGEAVAPVLTLFTGGNHEASNFLAELPHGGWVAPNIYFAGLASVLNFKVTPFMGPELWRRLGGMGRDSG